MRKWLIGLLMILGLCVGFAQAETYVVAVDGTGDFQTLTEAAAASSTGDTILLRAGVYGEQETFPIVLDHAVTIEGEDGAVLDSPRFKTMVSVTADGVTLTLTRMGPGGIFADILAGSRGAKSPVTVTAATDVTVLLIPYKSLLRPGVPLDAAHAAVLQNLVAAMADKYFALDRRVELLMLHSLREKVLHYLRTEALPAPGGAVRTPYTRAGLAAYLGCERSALCRELSRMRRDGILQIDGRVFRLLPGVPPRQNGTGRKTMECKHSSGVTQRLARIAGQVNGIRDMVEEGRPCDDLLVQLSSASSALTQVARLIMAEHLEHCVLAGFETGDRETTVENLKKALEQFSKMK